MKAIGYKECLPINEADSLLDLQVEKPVPGARDVLVEVKAISVNPADTKVRANFPPENDHRVLGFDASGVVTEVGSGVSKFLPGEEVFYAGAFDRPGTNSEFHVVDERIVGHKPKSLRHDESAVMPLTSITAWEILFERLGLSEGQGHGETLLIVGGAGGVGSILIQLARKLTNLTVVASASRKETRSWCQKMGAHYVINHHEYMNAQLAEIGKKPKFIAGLTATEQHFRAYSEIIKPQGHICLIDDPDSKAVDIGLLKPKSVSLHWEFMFTRSLFQTPDMDMQGHLLNRVSTLMDKGELQSTLTKNLGTIDADNLKTAHRMLEAGDSIGKVCLENFN